MKHLKHRLMNSAMMPRPGRYDYRTLSPQEFGRLVQDAHKAGSLISYIGYEQTARLIERLAGVPIPISREQTPVEDGDILLIAKLRYRVADPRSKGDPVVEDFEFGAASYAAPQEAT